MIKISALYRLSFTFSLLAILLIVIDFGFNQVVFSQRVITTFFFIVIFLNFSNAIVRYFTERKPLRFKIILFDIITLSVITLAILTFFSIGKTNIILNYFHYKDWIRLGIFLIFIKEVTLLKFSLKNINVNPAQIFIFSFFSVIIIGALLLMLPNATYTGISFVDALFTSTSAVCVTGLIVVDTATYFTHLGQTIIMVLIQIGGLGIITFVAYFSYFFKGGSSYKNQLVISDLSNSERIGEVFSLIKKVLFITFSIEFFGAILIFYLTENFYFSSYYEHFYFSVFHSISAFCNAGFSTLSNGLFDIGLRFNYLFQITIILLFIIGGLGFPIVVNLLKYLKSFLKHNFLRILNINSNKKPWVLTLNSRIILITSFLLTIIGSILIYFIEYNNTLVDHHGIGKIVAAIFTATTPRTAGFNTIDILNLSTAATLIIIFLMWIGASPGSTGGGIKTSTFAIATLNFISLTRGKTRIEVFRREISEITIRRAFAAIVLSLITIGFGIFLISIFDKDKSVISIAFECFSAFSTVGLSIGITSSLTVYSKLVIVCIMFIGRVSLFAILFAFIKKEKYKNYAYPNEEITIN
ncbi:MAG: ATPase [Bacteroidetes bacterium]|nr:ATPase [Bacteroidota bacterium]